MCFRTESLVLSGTCTAQTAAPGAAHENLQCTQAPRSTLALQPNESMSRSKSFLLLFIQNAKETHQLVASAPVRRRR